MVFNQVFYPVGFFKRLNIFPLKIGNQLEKEPLIVIDFFNDAGKFRQTDHFGGPVPSFSADNSEKIPLIVVLDRNRVDNSIEFFYRLVVSNRVLRTRFQPQL